MLQNRGAIEGIMDSFAIEIKTQMELIAQVYLSGSHCCLLLPVNTIYLQPD